MAEDGIFVFDLGSLLLTEFWIWDTMFEAISCVQLIQKKSPKIMLIYDIVSVCVDLWIDYHFIERNVLKEVIMVPFYNHDSINMLC